MASLEDVIRRDTGLPKTNGVIRIERKGLKKFAFGDGEPFEVDVVVVFQAWVCVDEGFRQLGTDRVIPVEHMADYHRSAFEFVNNIAGGAQKDGDKYTKVTVTEALEFLARLRECYYELVSFFQPKSPEEPGSPGSSGSELRFSEEPEQN